MRTYNVTQEASEVQKLIHKFTFCLTSIYFPKNRTRQSYVQEQAKFWGCERFCPEFPKVARTKSFQANSLCEYFHRHRSWTPFVMTSKKVFMWFSTLGRHFCLYFQGFCPGFRQIKTFEGVLEPPPPTPLTKIHCTAGAHLLHSFHWNRKHAKK